MMNTGLGERVKMARSMARLSQEALGQRAGVSKMAISKYEKEQMTPSSDVLIQLAAALGQRVDFFLRGPVRANLQPVYRGRAGLRNGNRREAEVLAQLHEWLERYLAVESLFPLAEIPHFAFPPGFPRQVDALDQVEDAAAALRVAWDLGENPIDNLTEVLEEQGVKVGLVGGNDHFDACLFRSADGSPVIAVKRDLPGDRQRFNLAHELGHLMVVPGPDLDPEKAASRFSGAFLVPPDAARYELGGQRNVLSSAELHLLKHKYGVSMAAWVYRAADLGILSPEAVRRQWQQFSRQGWRTQEPGDQLAPEAPQRLVRLVLRALAEKVIGQQRAGELLGIPWQTFVREQAQQHGDIPLAMRA